MLTNEGVVLIAEDDAALRHSLSSTLQTLGFKVGEVATGEYALLELRHEHYELVLLDLNMPGMGGLAACKRIREQHPKLQIMVLTVRDTEDDKVLALDAGADDYITKPFLLMELTARIRSAVRRMRTPEGSALRSRQVGEIRVEAEQHRVFKRDTEVHLTPKEFDLLLILMQNAGKPLSHHKLLTAVWGEEYGGEREYLRTYMSQLRRKIEDDPAKPVYLTTENYIGYRFKSEP
ncbi:response regulator transcription factor [Edaphobacter sp. HDX4]|uniref:response regulator transcription factor n=1 Tax=Edaphobacter sp. HDX4 TaxID=2794064 RepID=UPI002FE55DF7